ncbi:MAG: response regulator [Chloroflexi bacterium]|nr:response regulator [Chloroflexota bacterium]
MMTEQSIQNRYFELLKAYVASPEEKFLALVAELGRELVVLDAPPEDIVELHERALGRLAQEQPNLALQDTIPNAWTPLMELLMIHSLAFRERSEARDRAEAALRASEELLRQILDTSPNCVFVKDRQGRFILVNEAVVELYDIPADEIVGRTERDLAEMSKSSVEAAERSMMDDLEVIESKQSKFTPEEPFVLWDGTTKWFQVTKMPLIRENTPDCVLVIAVDITERKRAEELMRQQERLAAVGQLATNVALDFNNIMTSITLTTQMLKDQLDAESNLSPSLDIILSEAQRASDLVVQILDFSHRSYIKAQPVDLKPLINEVAETLQRTLPESIHFLVEVGQKAYMVDADSARIRRAVMNLVVNARDAMPEGGEIRVRLSRMEVEADEIPLDGIGRPVTDMIPGEWVCITVSDTGFSIPPQDLPYIFEPFSAAKILGRKTGYSLAQVYGIVIQHDGHIDVKTAEERGTTFQIYLPAREAEQMGQVVEEVEEDTVSTQQGGGEIILLVEDENNIRVAAERILKSLGYKVLTATDGQEALQIYRASEGIDLLITDLVMPEIGGKELLRELKKTTPDLKSLAITGYVSPVTLQELRDEGFLAVVSKPFTMDVLAGAIHRALDED